VEGDVVLDQFVTGLLATPCIRRRLDKLYGKAPARSLSEGSQLDLLPSELTSQITSQMMASQMASLVSSAAPTPAMPHAASTPAMHAASTPAMHATASSRPPAAWPT